MPSHLDEDIFAKALSLPAPERARLAHELIASLDEGDDDDVSTRWLAEIERRLAEIDPGRVALENWRTVRARWQARWRKP